MDFFLIDWSGAQHELYSQILKPPPTLIHTHTHTHQFLHRDSSSPVAKLPPLTQSAPNRKYGGRSLYNYRQSQRVQGIVSGMV